jgi:hypothetical protein
MVTFRKNSNHNNRRGRFRTGVRNFKRNGEGSKFKSDFSSSANFQRKSPGRNNHNASQLIEKYNDLAREALASEDKILSENYFQYADHFIRVLSEQEKNRAEKASNDLDKNESKTISAENHPDKNQKIEKSL